jgi:hypothetical protein
MNSLPSNMGCNHIFQSKNEVEERTHDYSNLVRTDLYHFDYNCFIMAVPLDSVKYQFKNKISVVKIDVEGYELHVLKGMEDIIWIHRPVIIVEIWERINWAPVTDFLKALNYLDGRKILNRYYMNEDYLFLPRERFQS